MTFFKTYQKFVASVTAVCFLFSFFTLPPGAQAQPIEVSIAQKNFSSSLIPLGIPPELASIQEAFIPDGESGFPLIHIQSVHAHPETQRKIYALLKFLNEKYGIDSLFI